MPSEKKQNSPTRSNGGTAPDQGLRERVQDVTDRMQGGFEQAGSRLHQGYESASQALNRGVDQAGGLIAQNPATAVMIGFGLGFGVGLLLTSLMSERESWYDRYVPDSIRDLQARLGDLNLPESLARHLSRS